MRTQAFRCEGATVRNRCAPCLRVDRSFAVGGEGPYGLLRQTQSELAAAPPAHLVNPLRIVDPQTHLRQDRQGPLDADAGARGRAVEQGHRGALVDAGRSLLTNPGFRAIPKHRQIELAQGTLSDELHGRITATLDARERRPVQLLARNWRQRPLLTLCGADRPHIGVDRGGGDG
jgi:hypothetical protein